MSQKKSGNFEQNIKSVLSWVVVSRVMIAHIYIFTHVLNLCSILMWSQRRMLLPWMVISAFKNFILEVIVFIVVVLLYIEGNISDYLLGGIVIEKLISVGLAAQNWFTINAFYMRLKELDQKKLSKMSQRKASTFNLMIGMSMRHSLTLNEPDQHTKKRHRFISVPNLGSLPVDSLREFGEETNSIRISKSLNTISMLSIRYFDHKDNIFNADGFRLPIAERVIMILGVPFDYVEKVSFNSSISQANTYPPITIQEESSSLSCTCPSDGQNSDESDSKESEKIESFENYSSWTEQWTMKNFFENQKFDIDKASLTGKSVQYSEASELGSGFCEESFCNLETKASEATYLIQNNIRVQENAQNVSIKPIISEVVEATEEDKTIFETWIRDLVYVGILKKEVSLFEDSERKSVLKETGANSRSSTVQRQTQTEVPKWENVNQVNFVTVQNLTLPRSPVSGWDEYGEGLKLKKSFEKAKKENKELEALKLYNEKTLWRYKRLMDLEKLKPVPLDMLLKDEKKNIKVPNLNIKLSHRKDMQKGRELDKIKAVENIPASFASEKLLPEKKFVDLKTRIAQIDWAFPRLEQFSAQTFKYKQTVFDVIDDRDTATLLQSAFSFDNHEFRGFPLGPREFYSARNDYIPNVFEEIVKAARSSVIRHDCPNYSTLEIDYGDDYLKDLETFGGKEVLRTEISKTEIIRSSNVDVESQLRDLQVTLIEDWVKKFSEIVSSNGNRSLEELARFPGFRVLKKLINEIDTLASNSVVSAESSESVNSLEVGLLNTEDSGIKENFGNENNIEFIKGSEPVNEAHLSIFDDECNWSDESATFLNFDQTSEVSLGNESNMSEFSAFSETT
ncbi:uncharacterized protein LOC123264792 isoform X1 [Cotesia glomerata]|uniref:uncharacterized protein LOC123264792 isoform X1 n=1 Tax=Cotesia glomerata TaxID=32391 RepID=UPI001D031993|nr:uncharacterized protein LOC123264792 isoform X1 [Cotesia glomerata]